MESLAWAKGGHWRPATALIIGPWWVLREIESSSEELRSIILNPMWHTVVWTLPASKCDSSALGVTITHGCCCQQAESGRLPSPFCPYHLMKRHLLAYKRKWPRRFRRNGKARRGVPLFPDRFGKVCAKIGVTGTIRSAAPRQGMATREAGGLSLHSGHALMATDSQAMSTAGFPEHTIALVARPVVLRALR